MVSKWKHGICSIGIITFNEELEFISTSIIELINIYESSRGNSIVIFITKKVSKKKDNTHVTEDEDENSIEFSYS